MKIENYNLYVLYLFFLHSKKIVSIEIHMRCYFIKIHKMGPIVIYLFHVNKIGREFNWTLMDCPLIYMDSGI